MAALDGKVAIVAGGGTGIGRAIARCCFARRGRARGRLRPPARSRCAEVAERDHRRRREAARRSRATSGVEADVAAPGGGGARPSGAAWTSWSTRRRCAFVRRSTEIWRGRLRGGAAHQPGRRLRADQARGGADARARRRQHHPHRLRPRHGGGAATSRPTSPPRAGSTRSPAPPPSSWSRTASASTSSPRHHRHRHQHGRAASSGGTCSSTASRSGARGTWTTSRRRASTWRPTPRATSPAPSWRWTAAGPRRERAREPRPPHPALSPGGEGVVEVVAAVIERDGRILIARRPAGTTWPGSGSSPAASARPGESAEAALVAGDPRGAGRGGRRWASCSTTVDWRYPEKTVRLRFFRCALEGEPRAARGPGDRLGGAGRSARATSSRPPTRGLVARLSRR